MGFKNLIFILAAVSLSLTGCKSDSSFAPMRTELDNGMVILTQKSDVLPIVAVSVWAKVGSAYEKEGQYGISHFLEHMLFRRVPSSEKQASIQAKIEGAGGHLNGATGKEITYYFAVVPKDFAEEALDLLLDLFLNPDFNQKDFVEEKKVIIEEISRKHDNPSDLLEDLLIEKVYKGHPYGHPVLGDEDTIKKMKLDSLVEYHKNFYHPGNMVVSLAGNFDQAGILKILKAKFNNLGKQAVPRCGPFTEIEKGIKKETVRKNINQTYFSLGFAGPSVENDEHFALDLLAVILGEGSSSRLIDRLKEREKLVNTVDAHFFTQKASGLFSLSARFSPENLEKVEAAIWEEMERLRTGEIKEDELEKAKRIIEAHFYYQHETFNDQALSQAYWECLGVGNYERSYLAKIAALEADALKRAALKYLNPQNFTRVIIKPQS